MDKHPKRPRDLNQLAKMVVDIASGEEKEPIERTVPSRSAGGAKRISKLSETDRKKLAKRAASKRWTKS